MRAPLYASSEFPNANPELHAGRIDPALWPDVDDAFGDGDVLVVEELPELTATEREIEVVGEERETARESMIRLVAAVAQGDDSDDWDSGDSEACPRPSVFDLGSFSSLAMPTLAPLDPLLLASVDEADVDREPLLVATPEDEPATAHPEIDTTPADATPADATLAVMEPADSFARLVETICDVAAGFGVSVSAVAMMELLSGRPVPPVVLGAASGTLVAAGIAEAGAANELVVTPKLKPAAAEWARIVRDEGGDLEACGGKTLDEFAADIACAIVGDRSKFEPLRRALRGRGIAAFGLVCDAA